jgi:O-antigen/teichoic acid export membrane protein
VSEIKQKTISGLFWSLIDVFSSQGTLFIVGIILARLLSPFDFGLIGTIAVLIAISDSIVNSGFSNALIRKVNCNDDDYTTVFYFNILISVFLYILLYFSAPIIAIYFKQTQLTDIVRVLSLVIIIDAFSLIQRTVLIKQIDFKSQTKVSIISSIASGLISIVLALNGFGVWSLVWQRIFSRLISLILLWSGKRWFPNGTFNVISFKGLFGFGSRLLLSGLIDTVYNNIYLILIGKYFSVETLGFFSKSQEFSNIPSQGIGGIINRVAYPVLSSFQDDKVRLKEYYRRLIRSSMFVTSLVMVCLAASSESVILTLIGIKWINSISYLQLLCFVGILYPLHLLNLSILQVQGRSDLYLKLEVIKKLLGIPLIILGVIFGVKVMIIGMLISSILSYFLNSYWSGNFIDYGIKDQLKDIIPSLLWSFLIGLLVFFIGEIIYFPPYIELLIQIFIGLVSSILLFELIKLDEYIFMKHLLIAQLGQNQ